MEKTLEKTTQTYDKYCLGAKMEEMIYKNRERTRDFSNANPIDPEKILKNEAKCKYFIELFPEQFNILFDFLGEEKYALNYWNASSQRKNKCTLGNKMPLTEKDQLFITLLRLSRGFNLYTSAHFYSVSESYIRKMFTTWIAFLYHHFKDLKEVMLPVRDVFQHVKPKVFKNFKNIRCSVDFTEFFCEVPRNYAQQGNIIYSAYKYIYIFHAIEISSLEKHTRLSTTF